MVVLSGLYMCHFYLLAKMSFDIYTSGYSIRSLILGHKNQALTTTREQFFIYSPMSHISNNVDAKPSEFYWPLSAMLLLICDMGE